MKNNRRFPTLAITFVLLLSLFSPAASAVSTANANLTPTSNSEKIADIMEAGEQYMGADIEETGISACITKEGRLQVICELAAPATRSGASDSEMKRYVLSTLLVVDQFSNEVPYSAKVLENTGSSQDVYAVHTTYIDYRADPDNPGLFGQIRVGLMETYFEYGSALTATSFYHYYKKAPETQDEYYQSDPISFPKEGRVYSDVPDNAKWYSLGTDGSIGSAACVTVGNTEFKVWNIQFFNREF